MPGSYSTLKGSILSIAENAGFINPRILSPFTPEPNPDIPLNYRQASPSLLVAALPYGNQEMPGEHGISANPAYIAPFAQRNYYREAVKRLQGISLELRKNFGGKKGDYRILCNSPVPEKPLAERSGVGCMGRNSLVITEDAGSLIVLAAMTLPFELEPDMPWGEPYYFCESCDRENPPCRLACPTGALRGDGTIGREKCIQWYASGNRDRVPPDVLSKWGKRLYGCTDCQDACICNQRPVPGTESAEGILPECMDAAMILEMGDDDLKKLFRGTAMGLSWLGPGAIRRNAAIVLGTYKGVS